MTTKQEKIREEVAKIAGGFEYADLILAYLHAQRVVIKKNSTRHITADRDTDAFIETVAVEPLIEDV